MVVETKLTEANQTQVPAHLRERFGLRPGDLVVWEETTKGEIRIRFRSRRTWDDLIGIAPGASRGNSVRAKKQAQRGEL